MPFKHLNVGKKIQMIQVAFVYMGKPAVFNRIIGKYPDLGILLEYAKSNTTPALTGGDGVIRLNKTVVLENPDTIGLEYIRTGQITTAEYEVIHCLSMVIRMERDYMSICDSLGVPLEYGPQATPRYQYVDVANRSNSNEILFEVHKLFIQDG